VPFDGSEVHTRMCEAKRLSESRILLSGSQTLTKQPPPSALRSFHTHRASPPSNLPHHNHKLVLNFTPQTLPRPCLVEVHVRRLVVLKARRPAARASENGRPVAVAVVAAPRAVDLLLDLLFVTFRADGVAAFVERKARVVGLVACLELRPPRPHADLDRSFASRECSRGKTVGKNNRGGGV
jgi:hypothetical protein